MIRHSHGWHRRPACAALGNASVMALLLALQGGCVTEGPPPREAPRDLPQQPAHLKPDRLVFSVANFATDSDNNGYADTFDASVYLFSEGYQFALATPGSLSFTLTDRSGRLLARWTFDQERSAKMLTQLPPGWGYAVQLSLLDVGGDNLQRQTAELSCEFVPAAGGGAAVQSRGRPTVQIGRLR